MNENTVCITLDRLKELERIEANFKKHLQADYLYCYNGYVDVLSKDVAIETIKNDIGEQIISRCKDSYWSKKELKQMLRSFAQTLHA